METSKSLYQRSIATSSTNRRAGLKNRVMLGSDMLRTRHSCRDMKNGITDNQPSMDLGQQSLAMPSHMAGASIFDKN